MLSHVIFTRKLLAADAATVSLISEVALAPVGDEVALLAEALTADFASEGFFFSMSSYMVIKFGQIRKLLVTS